MGLGNDLNVRTTTTDSASAPGQAGTLEKDAENLASSKNESSAVGKTTGNRAEKAAAIGKRIGGVFASIGMTVVSIVAHPVIGLIAGLTALFGGLGAKIGDLATKGKKGYTDNFLNKVRTVADNAMKGLSTITANCYSLAKGEEPVSLRVRDVATPMVGHEKTELSKKPASDKAGVIISTPSQAPKIPPKPQSKGTHKPISKTTAPPSTQKPVTETEYKAIAENMESVLTAPPLLGEKMFSSYNFNPRGKPEVTLRNILINDESFLSERKAENKHLRGECSKEAIEGIKLAKKCIGNLFDDKKNITKQLSLMTDLIKKGNMSAVIMLFPQAINISFTCQGLLFFKPSDLENVLKLFGEKMKEGVAKYLITGLAKNSLFLILRIVKLQVPQLP